MAFIIPSLTLTAGKCITCAPWAANIVKPDLQDAVTVAGKIADNGFRTLNIIDMDGQRDGKVVHYRLLERIATATRLDIQYGGGIENDDAPRIVFESGGQRVIAGSTVLKNRPLLTRWLQTFGKDKIVVAVTVSGERVVLPGDVDEFGRQPIIQEGFVYELVHQLSDEGVKSFIIKELGDAAPSGVDLYEILKRECSSAPVFALGGVTSLNEIETLILAGASGVIVTDFDLGGPGLTLPMLSKFCTTS